MRLGGSNEDSIVEKISRAGYSLGNRTARMPLALGVGDDAALFRPQPGHETILTCDWFLEGTHFLRDKHPPDAVGWKCLARAVSDIAAMGGTPRCFLLSLALPAALTGHWLEEFLGGLRRAARRFECLLAGGDTTRREEILINVTVIGEVRRGRSVRRSGAKPGDLLYVSGRLGEAELGFQLLKRASEAASRTNALTRKHFYPEPRLSLGQWLGAKGLASAMMDLSDGLSSDLPRLCATGGVGARVEPSKIPAVRVSDADRKHGFDPLRLALDGGDDYELLFTVPPGKAKLLPRALGNVALTPIGKITKKRGVLVVGEDGREHRFVPGGWDPFRARR
ncbi:MAG TPA: thiamine-phosphate kinase [Candidatus Acidoferrum sp.]|nr:thiamine-phosphate kinase [Candidatus Acidoferrum sp.]